MAIDKLMPRVLNQDKDEKIVAPSEFVDANNLRVTVDEQGNGGVIKNLKSDLQISLGTTIAAGTNSVVAVYSFELIDTMFFFVNNSEGDHSIWYYNVKDSTATLLIQDAALDILAEDVYYIDGVVYGDTRFLYFTNGRSEPMKVNVTACQDGGVSWPAGSTTTEKRLELCVAKAMPAAPTAAFDFDQTISDNGLVGESFQFALQYVYRDGEVSALGHYSQLYVAPNTLNETVRTTAWLEKFNKMVVSFGGSTDAVDKIRIFYRHDSNNPFFYIDEVDNTGSTQTYDFYHDKAYIVHPDEETNKLFDAVPKTAAAQEYMNGRLVYGNYTEGFDVGTITADLSANYYEEPVYANTNVSPVTSWTSNRINARIDLTAIPDNGTGGSLNLYARTGQIGVNNTGNSASLTLTLSDGVTSYTESHTPQFDMVSTEVNFTVPLSSWADKNDLSDQLDVALAGQLLEFPVFSTSRFVTFTGGPGYYVYYKGTAVLECIDVVYAASASGAPYAGLEVASINFKLDSYNLEAYYVENVTTGFEAINATSTYSYINSTDTTVTGTIIAPLEQSVTVLGTNGISSFKAGESHGFGVVFEDEFGRQSGVQEVGQVHVNHFGDSARGGKNGYSTVTIDPTGTRPTWAKSFFFVYSGGSEYSSFTQYAITEAFQHEDGSPRVVLSLRGLQGNSRAYKDGKGANIEYKYSEGDKVRIISYYDNNGFLVYPNNLEFDAVEFVKTAEAADAPFTASGGGAPDQAERSIGDFLVIDARNITGWGYTNVGANTDFWANECIVEIYNANAKKEVSNSIYYACSPSYPITQWSTNTYEITEGNVWYKPRLMVGFEFDSADPYTDANDAEMDTYVKYVESLNYSDFATNAAFYSKGKPSSVIYGEEQEEQYYSLTWSEQQNVDSPALMLGSFNNGFANFFDFEADKGPIMALIAKSDATFIIQKDGVAITRPNANVLQSGNQDLVTINTDFISDYGYFDSKLGIQFRGAAIEAETSVFGLDVKRGMLWTVDKTGVKIASENGMSKYFADFCAEIVVEDTRTGDVTELTEVGIKGTNIVMGYDRRNKELIISTVGLTSAILVSSLPETIYGWSRDYSAKAIVYNAKENAFASFRNNTADGYAYLNGGFYAVKGAGLLYKAESGTNWGFLLGTQYDMSFSVVSTAGPASVNTYNAVSVEGNLAPSVAFSTKKGSATLSEELFTSKEDSYYAKMPRTANGGEYVTIGKVDSIDGTTINFVNDINRVPFAIGGALYKFVSPDLNDVSATVDSIDGRRAITVSSSAGISVGDIIAVLSDGGIDGDSLRGHWLKAAFTFANSDATELGEVVEIYGVNFNYSPSNQHHIATNSQE